jgi:ketosteroid isomerase-like protein
METNAAETEIVRIVRARAEAVASGDVGTSIANFSDDVVEFDLVDPLSSQGKSSIRQRAQEWIGSFVSPPQLQLSDITVVAGIDVAFSYYFTHVTGDLKTGSRADMWFRSTLCFQKRNSRWQIVHEHGSVPFNPETGMPSLGLTPDRRSHD